MISHCFVSDKPMLYYFISVLDMYLHFICEIEIIYMLVHFANSLEPSYAFNKPALILVLLIAIYNSIFRHQVIAYRYIDH